MATRNPSRDGRTTREVKASDHGAGGEATSPEPPAVDGVPAQEGAVQDEHTGTNNGPMADGSPAPADA